MALHENATGAFARTVLCFLCVVAAGFGQQRSAQTPAETSARRFWFGVRGGVTFNSLVDGASVSDSTTDTDPPETRFQEVSSAGNHLAIGPTVGFNLSRRFAVSADLLYRGGGYDTSDVLHTQPDEDDEIDYLSQAYETTRADYWDVPILLRFYTSPSDTLRSGGPYVTGGVAFRKVTGIETFRQTINADSYSDTDNSPVVPDHSLISGAVFGGGIRLGRDQPVQADFEARFTRWFDRTFDTGLAHSGQNQFECLMSITF